MSGQLLLVSGLTVPLCQYLRAQFAGRAEPFLSGIYVGRMVPSPRRDRIITVANRGGVTVNAVVQRSVVDVNLWAKTEDEADDLAALVAALLDGASSPVLMDVRVQTTAQTLSPDDGQARRYIRLAVTHRAIEGV